jgi:Inner membrane protein YgaP-like, transmembrane domain
MFARINEAPWDRALRVIVGLAMLYLGWAGVVGGALGTVFKVLGFVPLITGIVGWCPAYSLFGVSTHKPTLGTSA